MAVLVKTRRGSSVLGIGLLITAAVLAYLALNHIPLPSFAPMSLEQRTARAQEVCNQIAQKIDLYEANEKTCIRRLSDLEPKYLPDASHSLDSYGYVYCLDPVERRVLSRGADLMIGTADDVFAKLKAPLAGILEAAKSGNIDAVKEFLEADRKAIDSRTTGDMTPLHFAVYAERTSEIRFLVENSADIRLEEAGKLTPLHYAARYGKIGAIAALIEKGVDVNLRNGDQATPLHAAATGGRADSARALLERGADVNARDALGNTALHAAVSSEDAMNGLGFDIDDLVKVLIAAKVDLNALDARKNTALALATYGYKTHDKAVEMLLAGGADPNIKNHDGKTPLENARVFKNQHLIDLLIARGAK